MSFFGYPASQAKKAYAEVLPDGRKRLTRYFQVSTTGQIPDGLDDAPGTADDWTDAPTGWSGLLLTYKKFEDDMAPKGADTRPILTLIFEQISASGETQTGGTPQTQLPDGRDQVEFTYVMFSDSTYTPQTPGTTTAPGPFTSYYLWTEETTDDGTLRNIKRIYQTPGTVKTTTDTQLNGGLLRQTITSFKDVPATPSGYTQIGTATQNPSGYPIYDYNFVAVATAGTPADAGQEISREYLDSNGGTTAFDPASLSSSKGSVRCVIKWITGASITTDPTTGPASFVRYAVDYESKDGYKIWTVQYAFASTSSNLIVDEKDISSSGALVIYHRVAFGAAPATPSATIGGTVTLFESGTRNETGYVVYDYRWAEGDGGASITTQGQPDGAIVYTVVEYAAAAATPAYPGAGSNSLISLSQQPKNGYYENTAIYKKWPATITFNKKVNFTKPGSASISGSPLQLVFNSPVTMDVLAEVEVSYSTSQISDVPFTVEAYATYYETYTPVDTGVAVASSRALGGYLAGASGTSGTGVFNGIDCTSWEYQLGSSTPSSFTAAVHVLDVDNDPYLTATDGTVVYRRTKVSYDFS